MQWNKLDTLYMQSMCFPTGVTTPPDALLENGRQCKWMARQVEQKKCGLWIFLGDSQGLNLLFFHYFLRDGYKSALVHFHCLHTDAVFHISGHLSNKILLKQDVAGRYGCMCGILFQGSLFLRLGWLPWKLLKVEFHWLYSQTQPGEAEFKWRREEGVEVKDTEK